MNGQLQLGKSKVRLGEPDENGERTLEFLEPTPVEDGTLGGEMVQLRPVKRAKKEASRAERKARLAEKNSRGLRGRIYVATLETITHPHWLAQVEPLQESHRRTSSRIVQVPGQLPRVVAD